MTIAMAASSFQLPVALIAAKIFERCQILGAGRAFQSPVAWLSLGHPGFAFGKFLCAAEAVGEATTRVLMAPVR